MSSTAKSRFPHNSLGTVEEIKAGLNKERLNRWILLWLLLLLLYSFWSGGSFNLRLLIRCQTPLIWRVLQHQSERNINFVVDSTELPRRRNCFHGSFDAAWEIFLHLEDISRHSRRSWTTPGSNTELGLMCANERPNQHRKGVYYRQGEDVDETFSL